MNYCIKAFFFRKELFMGKDLKGKELGVGICQIKNGKYVARFTKRNGKRIKKEFFKLQECRKWIADAQFDDEHGNVLNGKDPTVEAWYQYWIDNVKGDNIRYNTRRNYNERYEKNIKQYIGDMLLKDIKPLHCQNVLNNMSEKYANSVIEHSRLVMWMMFDSAVENDLISKNPVTKSVKCTSGRKSKEKRALTIDEQKLFLETIKDSSNYNQYAFVLQTGIRVGELIGLQWSDVDFKNKILHIRRTMEYRHCYGEWRTGEPKTKNSVRDIPLTQEAINILKNQKEKLRKLKIIPIEFSDTVFLCRKGTPTKNSAYDTKLFYYCDKAGIPRFSMHVLRHTFATRCIESGMRPKTLQMILGHSNIGITMNLYVHVTDDEKAKEIENIEFGLKVI